MKTFRLHILASVLAVLAVISGCHPLINAVDSGADNFADESTAGESSPTQFLPESVKWELAVPHAGTRYPLEISNASFGEPGFYVENRYSDTYYVMIHFGGPIREVDVRNAGLFAKDSDGVTTNIAAGSIHSVDEADGVAVYRFPRPLDPAYPDQAKPISVRMRLVDLSGVILGEREFGLLVGDFNADGVVNASDESQGPGTYAGVDLNSLSNPTVPEVRADINADGLVDIDSASVVDGHDSTFISNILGIFRALPCPPADFDGTPTTCISVGEVGPGGGLVFYDKGSVTDGWRYLEVSPGEVNTGIAWDAGSIFAGSTRGGLGEGAFNTVRAVAELGPTYATGEARAYVTGSLSEYDDWYLPTTLELERVHLELYSMGVGSWPVDPSYWSSTEIDGANVSAYDFTGAGAAVATSDVTALPIRAVRAFRDASPLYAIVYLANGATAGSVPHDPRLYKSGESATIKSNSGDLSIPGLLFESWNTLQSGGGTPFSPGDTANVPSNHTTLFAQWFGPLARYDFSPGSELIDSSPNGHDLSSSGDPTFQPAFDGREAIQFNADTNRLTRDFPSGLSAGSGGAISLWVYGDSLNLGAIVSAYDTTSGRLFYVGSNLSGRLNVLDGSGYTSPAAAGYQHLLNAGTWNHMVVSMDSVNGTTEVFVNGVSANVVSSRVHLSLANQMTFYAGNNGQGSNANLAQTGATIAGVRLFDRPITADQVDTIYNE